ncbi:MAG TPA: hypothetical protein DCQ64_00385 [Candidatus Rokubacteria bacterium]|nr:hypothetical protein [Candidatus Rokubacteria bacterium]
MAIEYPRQPVRPAALPDQVSYDSWSYQTQWSYSWRRHRRGRFWRVFDPQGQPVARARSWRMACAWALAQREQRG